jgi:hypothetical protein
MKLKAQSRVNLHPSKESPVHVDDVIMRLEVVTRRFTSNFLSQVYAALRTCQAALALVKRYSWFSLAGSTTQRIVLMRRTILFSFQRSQATSHCIHCSHDDHEYILLVEIGTRKSKTGQTLAAALV